VTVKIPRVLVNALPNKPSFLKVKARQKAPVGEPNRLYSTLMTHDDPALLRWLERGGNYGVAAGDGLVIIDLDHPELVKLAEEKLPRTFTVQSPGSKGRHLYFFAEFPSYTQKSISLVNPENSKENYGTIRVRKGMVVGPGSIHPNGGTYTVIDDSPIAPVEFTEIISVFGAYIKRWRREKPPIIQQYLDDNKKKKKPKPKLVDIIDTSKFTLIANNELQGPHPIHGSNI